MKKENAHLLLPLFICPSLSPLLSSCLFISGLDSTDWLSSRADGVTLGTVAKACTSQRRASPRHISGRVPARGAGEWACRFGGQRCRRILGRGALRLSDLVRTGVTAWLPGWEVERGRTEREDGHLFLTLQTPKQATKARRASLFTLHEWKLR